MRHRSLTGTTAVTLTLLLSACASAQSAGGPDGGTVTGDPVPGGTLIHVRSDNPNCIDPQQSTLHSTLLIGRQVAASLTDQDPDTGEVVPWLAESWEVSDDGTQYTFHLRDDVTFSDGTPVNATSVQETFDAVIDLGAKSALAASYLEGYLGTEILDEFTARVTFDRPSFQFLQASSTSSLGILASSTFELTPEERCQGGQVGAGPFVLDEYLPNQRVVLTRRDGYGWASALRGHQGEAYLEKVEIVIAAESSVRTGGLRSGEFDVGSTIEPQDEAALKAAGLDIQAYVVPGIVSSFFPNEARPLLKEPAVRQAVLKAIDRQEILDTLYSESYQAATSILSPVTPGYTDLSASLAYDLPGAREILDDAGWVDGADGIRERDGDRLTLTVITAASTPYLQLIQQQLLVAGIDLQIKVVPDVFVAQSSGDYDFFSWGFTRADPDALRTVFSSTFPQRKGQAFNDTLDALLADAAAATSVEERDPISEQAQREIVSQADGIPIVNQVQVYAVNAAVHGLAPEASARLDFYDTWKSE